MDIGDQVLWYETLMTVKINSAVDAAYIKLSHSLIKFQKCCGLVPATKLF